MIIFAHDVVNKILSRDSNHIVDMIMSPKFGSSRWVLINTALHSDKEVILIEIDSGNDDSSMTGKKCYNEYYKKYYMVSIT